jgi:Undecaprenyl-phosphate glucose phosphotransferase
MRAVEQRQKTRTMITRPSVFRPRPLLSSLTSRPAPSFTVARLQALPLLRPRALQRGIRSDRSPNPCAPARVVVLAHPQYPTASIARLCQVGGNRPPEIVPLPNTTSSTDSAPLMRGVIDHIRRSGVDAVLLAIDWAHADLIEDVADHLRVLPIPVRLLPDSVSSAWLARPLVQFGSTKVVELQRLPMTRKQRTMKRLVDVFIAALALPILSPLLLVIAALIAIDSRGPILFRQRRVGLNCRTFYLYKFRTMRVVEDGAVVRQAERDDDRVTRVGRPLRRLSLDELPQLLNVLKGEMSLVGPRPHAVAHDDAYGSSISVYMARHKVKPGITGWAQVNGWRGATPDPALMAKRVEHDIWYIDHWSVWLDFKIMLLTLPHLWITQNAY